MMEHIRTPVRVDQISAHAFFLRDALGKPLAMTDERAEFDKIAVTLNAYDELVATRSPGELRDRSSAADEN